MRLLIVGVGQTFNFETKTMDDMLQVQAPDGSLLSIPTTNEAAQALIKMAMNGEQTMPAGPPGPAGPPVGFTGVQGGTDAVARPEELAGRVEERFEGHPDAGDFPDGASLFGGEAPEGIGEGPVSAEDLEPEPTNVVEERVERQIFQKTQRTQGASRLGMRRNPADRSGVPSHGISRVDEKGNPILPAPPDVTMDDEEDPGEQV
jgi:hypothetical protein